MIWFSGHLQSFWVIWNSQRGEMTTSGRRAALSEACSRPFLHGQDSELELKLCQRANARLFWVSVSSLKISQYFRYFPSSVLDLALYSYVGLSTFQFFLVFRINIVGSMLIFCNIKILTLLGRDCYFFTMRLFLLISVILWITQWQVFNIFIPRRNSPALQNRMWQTLLYQKTQQQPFSLIHEIVTVLNKKCYELTQ